MGLLCKIATALKFMFPKPHMPQKRYILLIVSLIYFGLKVYVHHTKDPFDDQVLEQAHEVVLQLLADAKDSTYVVVNSPDAGALDNEGHQIYGERS